MRRSAVFYENWFLYWVAWANRDLCAKLAHVGILLLLMIYGENQSVAIRRMLQICNLLWVDASAPTLLDLIFWVSAKIALIRRKRVAH